MTPTTKICKKCGESKSSDEFAEFRFAKYAIPKKKFCFDCREKIRSEKAVGRQSNLKYCPKCRERKPESDFGFRTFRKKSMGIDYVCLDCNGPDYKREWLEHLERVDKAKRLHISKDRIKQDSKKCSDVGLNPWQFGIQRIAKNSGLKVPDIPLGFVDAKRAHMMLNNLIKDMKNEITK